MTMRFAALLLAGCALAGPAFALDQTHECGPDATIRCVAYSPRQLTQIEATLGQPFTITITDREHLARIVASEDGVIDPPAEKEMQQVPIRSNIPLWPKKVGRTNFQIISLDADGNEHAYRLVIVVKAPKAPAQNQDAESQPQQQAGEKPPLSGLIFEYPADYLKPRPQPARPVAAPVMATGGDDMVIPAIATNPAPGPVAAPRAPARPHRTTRRELARQAAEAARVQALMAVNDHCTEAHNYRFIGWGDRNLAPVTMCDNGEFTLLHYPGRLQPPAFFAVGADGSEQALPPPARTPDGWVRLPLTAPEFHLRLGRAVLYIRNLGYDRIGHNEPGGAPGIIRELRMAAQ